jgi:hypothetical protein
MRHTIMWSWSHELSCWLWWLLVATSLACVVLFVTRFDDWHLHTHGVAIASSMRITYLEVIMTMAW